MQYRKQLKIIQMILFFCDVNGTLVIFPKDLNVTAGNNVRFPCSTNTNKAVTWQHGKQLDRMADVYIGGEGLVRPYSKSSRHSMDEDPKTGRYDLIISNVTKEDEGIYICSEKASRENPPQARLTVTGVEESYSNRRDDIVVAIYARVSLKFFKCLWGPFYVDHVAVGRSHSDDVYNRNKLLNDYAQSGRFGFDDSNGMCQLLITNTQEKDAGTYTCRENAGLGKRCDLELIVVDGNPECAIKLNATELTPVTSELSCKVNYTGNHEPMIEWKHANESHLNHVFGSNGREVQSKLIVSGDAVAKSCRYVCEIGAALNTHSDESLQCVPSTDLCQKLRTSEVPTTPATITFIPLIVIVFLVAFVITLSLVIYKCRKKRNPLPTEGESQNLNRSGNRVV